MKSHIEYRLDVYLRKTKKEMHTKKLNEKHHAKTYYVILS